MFRLSNLRKESKNGWTYLRCDFDVTEMESPFKENSMWIAVEDKNEDMLSQKVYDPFVLVPVILGMYYGQDVYIDGNISARLHHNVTHYLMSIFDNFSDHTKKIRFTVNGFDTVEESEHSLVGTGISCGIDSLLTIYDNFIKEEKENFRINSLFFVNCGTHGGYNDTARRLWLDRAALNREAADELGLPMYLIDSNFHAFTHTIGEQKIGYLAIYSCALGMQKYVRRYLAASNFSYEEVAEFFKNSRDFDIAEYSETYMPHLIATERFELVIDGCQYNRGEKMERIADWDIAQKYLNVCVTPINHGHNCSNCNKCMWTLIPLEAMGKLDAFKNVFDINVYKENAYRWKNIFLSHEGKDAMETTVVRYARKKGMNFSDFDTTVEIYKLMQTVRALKKELHDLKYSNRNIVLFGAGNILENNWERIFEKIPVCAVVDNNAQKWGKSFGNLECKSPDELLKIENLYVLISIKNRNVGQEIREQLLSMGIKDIGLLSEWIEL